MNSSAGEIFNVCYAPDFDAPDQSSHYALRSGAKLCLFELRVSDLLRAGENMLIDREHASARPSIARWWWPTSAWKSARRSNRK